MNIKKCYLAITVLMVSAISGSGMEHLKISVQCPHVFLSWPSVESETFLVQHRETLDTGSPWLTLTNEMPAATGTNWTTFVHPNQVTCQGMMNSVSPVQPYIPSPALVEAVQKGVAYYLLDPPPMPNVRVRTNGTYLLLRWEEVYGPQPPIRLQISDRLREKVLAFLAGLGTPEERASDPLLETGQCSTSELLSGLDGPLDSGGVTNMGFYRVVRNGIHIWGVTNGTRFSGLGDLPLELGTTNEGVPGIHLYVDGMALSACRVEIPAAGFPIAHWDTAFIKNGDYALHAECDFIGSAEVLVSGTNGVTVSNAVTFDPFTTIFGGQMWVQADLPIAQADFAIDMFGDSGYIGTFSGNTTDGQISFLWDLIDPLGQTLNDAGFEGAFYVAAPGGEPRTNSAARRRWYRDYSLSGDGFVVAWALTKLSPFGSRIASLMQNGVVDILASPAADAYLLSPENTYNGSTFRLTASTKTNLLTYLADSSFRNFYFFGHGNASSFGDYSPLQGWLANISDAEVRTVLTNNFPAGTNLHPYRFAFLDSCMSANGSLPDAFGVAKHQVHRGFYRDLLKVMPRVFVGYTKTDIKLPVTSDDYTFNEAMLGQFLAEWRDGASINGIVERAKQNQYWPLDPSAIVWGATNLYRYY